MFFSLLGITRTPVGWGFGGKAPVLVITADTREQKMLDFEGIEGVDKVEEIGMSYGDYGAIIDEKVCPIFFERKGLSDLFGTMTGGYERYKKEMARAKDNQHKLILLIEGTYTDVWNGIAHSKFDGESMIKKLHTLYIKYDHEFWFCESRRVMARRIVDTYSAIQRNWAV